MQTLGHFGLAWSFVVIATAVAIAGLAAQTVRRDVREMLPRSRRPRRARPAAQVRPGRRHGPCHGPHRGGIAAHRRRGAPRDRAAAHGRAPPGRLQPGPSRAGRRRRAGGFGPAVLGAHAEGLPGGHARTPGHLRELRQPRRLPVPDASAQRPVLRALRAGEHLEPFRRRAARRRARRRSARGRERADGRGPRGSPR